MLLSIVSILLGSFFFLFSHTASAKNYGAKICANDAQFSCYKAKKGDTWQSVFKDEKQRDVVMRINRMNTPLLRGMTIAVPVNLNQANIMDYSPFPKQINPPGKKVIFVSIEKLAFGAYGEQGDLQYWGPVSTARGYCPDLHHNCHTILGEFTIYRKQGAHCVSTKFPIGRGGAPMPYCMYFHGGFALHGSYNVPGYNDSHGCVRLLINDAKWLNEEFTKVPSEVSVVIKQR